MTLITIREKQATETGFNATVSFDRQGEYPIAITSPFSEEEEWDLEWYFEQWIQRPNLENRLVDRVKANLKRY